MYKSLCTSVFITLIGCSLASGGETWNFDVASSGQDVSWVSPTSVDPGAAVYATSYQITLVEVDVMWIGIPFNNIDVTNQLPAEFQTGALEVPGPAPIAAFNQVVSVPGPPDPPAFAGTLSFGLDANGFGFSSATNVTFGNLMVDLGLFGVQSVTLTSLRIVGQLSIHPAWFDQGNALAGSAGTPSLVGSGTLIGGDPIGLTLSGAAPLSSTLLFVGLSELNAPFQGGGILVPTPDILISGLPTDVSGNLVISTVWPAGVPADVSFYFQYLIIDGAAPAGVAASNGLQAVTQ